MKLNNIIDGADPKFHEIALNCQQFLEESENHPLVKYCSRDYPDVHRVKVRKRKPKDNFSNAFNEVFYESYPSLRERSIIINSVQSNNTEPFFVFPSDGFKFIYSPMVKDSKMQYGNAFDDITSTLSEDGGKEVFQEMISYVYTDDSLQNAIVESSEIIVYNIPYFYVVRCNIEYDKILGYIK